MEAATWDEAPGGAPPAPPASVEPLYDAAPPAPAADREIDGLRAQLAVVPEALKVQEETLRAYVEQALESLAGRLAEAERCDQETARRLQPMEEALAALGEQVARGLGQWEALPGMHDRLESLARALQDAAGRDSLAGLEERLSATADALRSELESLRAATVAGEDWRALTARQEGLAEELRGLQEARRQADDARAALSARLAALAESIAGLSKADLGANLVSDNLGGILRRLEEAWSRLDRADEQLAALTRQLDRRTPPHGDAPKEPSNRVSYL